VDQDKCDLTIKTTIASGMTGVSIDNILDFKATSPSRRRRLGTVSISATDPSIDTSYIISVHDATSSYSELSTELKTYVSDGKFTAQLRENAKTFGVPSLENAYSDSVETTDLSPSKDDDNVSGSNDDNDNEGLSGGAIAGIVIGVVFGVAIFIALAYYIFVIQAAKNGEGTGFGNSELARNPLNK